MEDDWQPFARDYVKDLLHQNQSLAGSEVGHSTAGHCESFTGGSGTVLGFSFQELYPLSPEVALPICELGGKAVTHRGRGGDWICHRRLRDVGLYPHDSARSVCGGRNSGITGGSLISNWLVKRNGGHSVSIPVCAHAWPYIMLASPVSIFLVWKWVRVNSRAMDRRLLGAVWVKWRN